MAASPKGQTVLPAIESTTLRTVAMSRLVPSPSSSRVRSRSSQPVPSRQGVHLPQDSCL